MKKRKPTIAAIASEANVSPATVSRVINHRNLVNESTIRQVEDAMLRLGIAVNEKKKINNEKKVILFSRETGNTTFYDQICKGILKSTQANGYHLIVNYDSINRGNIGDFIMLLKRANVSGLILSSFLSEDLLDALNAVVPLFLMLASMITMHQDKPPDILLLLDEIKSHLLMVHKISIMQKNDCVGS